MNPTLRLAVVVVTGALIAYSIAVITEQHKKTLTSFILGALATGLLLDAVSTILMIAGSRHIPLTIHGILGYSAFAAMLTDTILLFRSRGKNRKGRTAAPWFASVYEVCISLVGCRLSGRRIACDARVALGVKFNDQWRPH